MLAAWFTVHLLCRGSRSRALLDLLLPNLAPPRMCRVLFQDTSGSVFFYNAVRGELMHPPDFEGSLAAAVWDSADAGVVAAVNSAGEGRGEGQRPAGDKGTDATAYAQVPTHPTC